MKSATYIFNSDKGRVVICNAFTIMDAAFIFAGSVSDYALKNGVATDAVFKDLVLIGFCELENNEYVNAMKAIEGVNFGKYGLARLYDTVSWTKTATNRPRKDLMKELRKTLSREGNRYMRELFIKENNDND
jgi:hypothetical protein